MKLRSLISTCSTTSTTITTMPPPSPNPIFSDTTSISLNSNLSLQTLPSVRSLQTSPENINLNVSHSYLTTIKPYLAAHVNHLAVNNTRLYAAVGNIVHVYDTASFALTDVFSANDAYSGSIKSVMFDHKGNVYTSHQDSKIRVWKLNENKKHKHGVTLPTLEDRLLRAIFSKNYVSVRRHRKRLWIEHHDAVSALSVVNDGLMCSVSWDKYLKIWNTSSFKCVESVKAHDDAINAVMVAGDGTIYTGSADRRIKVWGKVIGEKKYGLIATLEKHKSAVNALALNGVGSILFSGACDRSILVWEKEDSANYMAVTGALRGHSKAILCLVTTKDLLFSGSADRTTRIWQRGLEGKFCCLTVLDGHRQPVRSLVAHIDASSTESVSTIKVFSGSFEGEIKIWKVEVSNLASPMSRHLLKMKL